MPMMSEIHGRACVVTERAEGRRRVSSGEAGVC